MTNHRQTVTLERLLLAAIFFVVVTSTVVWTLRDKTPPPWDPSDHIRYAYDYYRLLSHGDFRGFAHEFFEAPHFYAPLVHLISAAFFLVVGASRLTALIINFLSLALLLFSVSWLARFVVSEGDEVETAQPKRRSTWLLILGVLAAMIAACSHFSAWLIHDSFLDFPLTAAVAVSMALLVRAGDFTSRRCAIQFAVAAGLGLLVKQTFGFFFVLPAIYATIRVLASRNGKAIFNLLLAGVVIAVIASVWYWPHMKDIISIYHENQKAAVDENEAPLFTFDSSFFPVHALLSFQLQVPFAVLFVIGLFYALVKLRKPSMIVFLWLASGLGMFALIANKDVRYTVPVIPAAAVFCVCWLHRMALSKSRRVRVFGYSMAGSIAVWSLISFFNAQWPRDGMGYYINTPRYQWMVLARNYFGFDHHPLSEDWSVPEIVQSVVRLGPASEREQGSTLAKDLEKRATSPKEGASPAVSGGQTDQPTLGVIVNLPHLNPSAVALHARLLAKGRGADPLVRVQWLVVDGSLSQIDSCDYLLARTGLESADWVASIEREFENTLRKTPDRFEKVESLPIPLKNAEAVIYRVVKDQRRNKNESQAVANPTHL